MKNKINKANAVVKIAQIKKSSSIEKEVYILRKLQDQNNIPNLYDYDFNDNINILVESLLGPNLNKIINFTDCGFEISIVAVLGIQMIETLKSLHEKYILHNDIKPSNICWGKFINGKFSEKKNLS